MTREEAVRVLGDNRPSVIFEDEDAQKRMAELCQAIDMAIEALSAERTGEWIDRNDEDVWNYCSVCGEQSIDLFDYCPNCGAKMGGDTE